VEEEVLDKFINKAEVMLGAMSQVVEEWENLPNEKHELLAEKYPFDKSFDEVVFYLNEWWNT
jgi:hypothetical protein